MKNIKYESYTYDDIVYNIPVQNKKKYRICQTLVDDAKKILDSKKNEIKNPKRIIKKYKCYSWNINKKIRVEESKEKKIIAIKDILFGIKDILFNSTNEICYLESILREAKMYDNIIVNIKIRGEEFEWIKSCFNEFKKDKNQNTFPKVDFCSTYSIPILNRKSLFKKPQGYLLVLVPKNSKAMYLDFIKMSCYKKEKEILLQKGSVFKFIEDKKFNDKNIFVVKLIQ